MKVCDIPYQRCDVETVKKAYEKCIESIKNAKSADDVLAARKQLLSVTEELNTESALSYMRWSCNTKDEFYKAEKEYYEQNAPLLSGVQIAYMQAMMSTPFRTEVEKRLPVTVYKNYEVSLKALDESIVPDLQEESAIVNEYSQFMSEFTVDFRGEKMPLTILRRYMEDADRNTRKEAYDALGEVFEENSDILDGTFDRLVKVRDRMAKRWDTKTLSSLATTVWEESAMTAKKWKNSAKTCSTTSCPLSAASAPLAQRAWALTI